jgi:hypothetical protein
MSTDQVRPDVTRWEIPAPQALTLGELDEVWALTGIDVMSPESMTPGRIIAAMVVWQSHKRGTPMTLDEVLRTVSMADIVKMSTVDPTVPGATAPG